MEKADMELRLEMRGALGLRAVLRNVSRRERAVLYSVNLQPVRLALKAGDGKEIAAFDERSRMKFDNSVRAAMFRRIPAGGEMMVGEERFREPEQGWFSMQWGPFTYRRIPGGLWHVEAEFDARIGKATTGESVEAVWTGKVRSAAVYVELS